MKKCCNLLRLRAGVGVDENLPTPTPDSGQNYRLRPTPTPTPTPQPCREHLATSERLVIGTIHKQEWMFIFIFIWHNAVAKKYVANFEHNYDTGCKTNNAFVVPKSSTRCRFHSNMVLGWNVEYKNEILTMVVNT